MARHAAGRDAGVALFQQSKQAAAAGQLPRAAALAAQAAQVCSQAGFFGEAVTCSIWHARMVQQAGQPGEADAVLRAALAMCDHRGLARNRLEVLTELGAILELVGNTAEAMAAHREVLAYARAHDLSAPLAIACGNVGRLAPRMALPDRRDAAMQEARALLHEAHELFTALGKTRAAIAALIALGDLERNAGNLAAARDTLAAAAQQARSQGDSSVIAPALLNFGYVLRDLGETTAAGRQFAESRVAAAAAGDRLGDARAFLAAALGDADGLPPADAAVRFAEVEAAFAAIGLPAAALPATANRGAALARAGRLADAQKVLTKVQAQLTAAAERLGAAETGLSLAEIALTRRDTLAFERYLSAAVSAQLPERLGHRLALLQARHAGRALDLSGCAAAVSRALQGEPSRSTRFSAALMQAQLDVWAESPKALDNLRALALQAAASPRESAAVHSALADALAWFGDFAAAHAMARRAVAQWQNLGEPAGVAGAAITAAVTTDDPTLHHQLLAQVQVAEIAEFVDLHDVYQAAVALTTGDVPTHLAVCDRLVEEGAIAAAVGLNWTARALNSPLQPELLARRVASEAGFHLSGSAAGPGRRP